MSKPITLSFSVKSASELASTLGVSEKRKKRIFTIVDDTTRKCGGEAAEKHTRPYGFVVAKTGQGTFATKNGSKGGRSVRVSSRPRKRSNAKAAR